MTPSCASGSMPRASTTTAPSPVYFFGSRKLAATASASTQNRIHVDIDLCIQRIRINCDRRIELLAFVSEDARFDPQHIVRLQYVVALYRVLTFLAGRIQAFDEGAALSAARHEAAPDGDGLRNRGVSHQTVLTRMLHLAVDIELRRMGHEYGVAVLYAVIHRRIASNSFCRSMMMRLPSARTSVASSAAVSLSTPPAIASRSRTFFDESSGYCPGFATWPMTDTFWLWNSSTSTETSACLTKPPSVKRRARSNSASRVVNPATGTSPTKGKVMLPV